MLPGDEGRERVSRLPLSSSDISVLVNTAIELHSRALELEKASKWWVTPVAALLGILLGAYSMVTLARVSGFCVKLIVL